MDMPAEMESVDRLLHMSTMPDSFIPLPSIPCYFSFISFKQIQGGGGKKSDSLSGNHHLLMIGLRPAETRLACDLHSASLNLWSIERKILLCAKKKKKTFRSLHTSSLFGAFFCFSFSAYSSEMITNGTKIALLKCKDVG